MVIIAVVRMIIIIVFLSIIIIILIIVIIVIFAMVSMIISSDRSSYSDDGLLYIHGSRSNFFRFSLSPLMQLMLQVSLHVP